MECYNSTCSTPTVGVASSTFASAVKYFAAAQCLITEGSYPQAEIKDNEKFDFIIVGAGTSGCVVANRLSEVKDWNILVIEAGGDAPIEATIPYFSGSLFKGKYEYSWNYQTQNDERSNQGLVKGVMNWPRGKMIGGTSNINGMVYCQGNDYDYQRWYDAGNKEWSVQEVRRCFRKAENFQDKDLSRIPEIYNHYGHDGPLIINSFNNTPENTQFNNRLLAAWKEVGIKNVADLNIANNFGSSLPRQTVLNGERYSSSRAYLQPIKNRKNLKIMKNTLVTKILINSSKEAFGIVAEYRRKSVTILATKEVIISAGTINSPQLLMLSGIGSKRHLTSKNISTVVNLPMVGKNLTSHLGSLSAIICTNESSANIADFQFQVLQYFYNRSGILSKNPYPNVVATFALDKDAKYPEFTTYVTNTPKNFPMLRDILVGNRYKRSVVDSIVQLNKKYTVYQILGELLHQHSTGNISLASNNPKDKPLIFPHFFSNPRDLESLTSAVEKSLELVNTTFFKSVGAFIGRIKLPQCDNYELGSRDYIKCTSRNLITIGCHYAGTCRMGTDSSNSVITSRLKVHGVKGLRVIDASVMPYTISGNINGPCIMIGERGSELIREDYK